MKRQTDSDRIFLAGLLIGIACTFEMACDKSNRSDAVKDNACKPDVAQEDAEIVRQVMAGDVNAFEQLMKRYQHVVVAIVKKHVPYDQVEDTMQDVFVRSYRSLPTFKGESFGHWLSVIAVRTCYDFWREHYRSREVTMSSLTEEHEAWLNAALFENASHSFSEAGMQKEAREVLDWALERLSAGDRMALELVYLEGRSVKETAVLLGWSTANVKVRLFRSRKKLHALFTAASRKKKE